jgi:hypothetical protein
MALDIGGMVRRGSGVSAVTRTRFEGRGPSFKFDSAPRFAVRKSGAGKGGRGIGVEMSVWDGQSSFLEARQPNISRYRKK